MGSKALDLLLLRSLILHNGLETVTEDTLFIFAATVEVELQKSKPVELRSYELDQALKKPKTTVVELRALERCKFPEWWI